MSEIEEHLSKFYNYPPPKEAKVGSYPDDAASNPVLRGLPLAVALSLLRASSFVSGILWKGNRFDDLCKIKELDSYVPRWDPTVIPNESYISSTSPSTPGLKDEDHALSYPAPEPRKSPAHHYTCADYHAAYLSGKLTPRDVVDADLIRKAADASTERYREGRSLGPLDGVPIAMKDDGELDGYRRTMGSRLDVTNPRGGTEWSVKKMEEAGAIVIGKTAMQEFGLVLNPHNRNFYCGGSSSGSAYAVASGLVPIAHGADACGSIRNPASFTGIYGLKTTHGRVSRLPTIDLVVSEGVTGPLASSLDDLALAYRIMATPDPSHPTSRSFPSPLQSLPISSSPRSKKYLGVPESWIAANSPSSSVTALFSAAVTYYTTASASNPEPYTLVPIPIEIALPQLSQKAQALCCLTHASNHFRTPSREPDASALASLTAQTQTLVSLPLRHATALPLLCAQRLRALHMSHLADVYTRYPGIVIMYPTTPTVGWPVAHHSDVDATTPALTSKHGFIDPDRSLRTMSFAWLANFCGCPALTRPMGYAAPDAADVALQTKGGVAFETGDDELDDAPPPPPPGPSTQRELPVGVTGMAEWAAEERLIAWARDGEGLLGPAGVRRPDSHHRRAAAAAAAEKTATRSGDRWVDVLASAAALSKTSPPPPPPAAADDTPEAGPKSVDTAAAPATPADPNPNPNAADLSAAVTSDAAADAAAAKIGR